MYFKRATIGEDEKLRCILQNKIFSSEDRIPLRVEDIFYDQVQEYYCNDGAVFLKLDEVFIGYGQIIMRNKEPYIVNFGILPTYQNNGYGKLLLMYLLNIIYYKGKSRAKIKVELNNSSALGLYKSVGFNEMSQNAKWFLKVI
jgi:ribosomal protein S18 acetylase RimI-like enzyme